MARPVHGNTEEAVTELRLKAWAKINLTLEVLGKRLDGYHEVRTIIQTIDLADDVVLSLADEMSLKTTPVKSHRPDDDLCLRAAWALRRATGAQAGASIKLRKRIPEAAGLGGGSSDAAATLLGLNRLWGLNLSRNKLMSLGKTLGTDVPFFINNGTALATGRGEIITPLPTLGKTWVVLLVCDSTTNIPHGGGKTGFLYSLLDEEQYSNGAQTASLSEALLEGEIPDIVSCNAFQAVANIAFPDLDLYQKTFAEVSSRNVHMAGSGPTLFSLFSDGKEASHVVTAMKNLGYDCYISMAVGQRAVDDFG